MKSFVTAMMVAAGLGLATLGARAQESTGPITPVKPGPVTPTVQPTGQRLTLEEVGRMLQTLGYNPKPYQDKAGKLAGYDLEFPHNGWTMRFSVSLSAGGTNLWVNGTIARVVDLAGVPGHTLLKLFGEHNRIWPSYVYFFPGSGYLRLAQPTRNSGLTSFALKKDIDSFATTLQQMITLWKNSQAAPAPAPLPAPLP